MWRERAHHVMAEEARTAEDGDQRVDVGLGDHATELSAFTGAAPTAAPAAEYKIGSRLYRGPGGRPENRVRSKALVERSRLAISRQTAGAI